jgi:hypothetical protein
MNMSGTEVNALFLSAYKNCRIGNMRTLIVGLLLAASLHAQYGHQRFSWQEACYKNFGLPYCQGRDFAIKPQPKGKTDSARGVRGDPDPFPAANVTPSEIAAGAIDWRFADPSADTLVGFHARRIAAEPVARKVIAQLGGNLGLTPAEIGNIVERLSGVEQVAISASQNQTVIMVTGRESDSTLPPLEPGWKATPVGGNAILVGQVEAVDQALQRLTKDDPPGEMMRLAMKRQADNEFWTIGFAGLASRQTESTKVKGFSLEVCIRDHLTSELALEFNGPPDAKALAAWDRKGAIECNVIHVTTTIEANEVQQKLGQTTAANPMGEYLTALVKPARYLPMHEATVPKQAKPVIFGLD